MKYVIRPKTPSWIGRLSQHKKCDRISCVIRSLVIRWEMRILPKPAASVKGNTLVAYKCSGISLEATR